jgi:hypothetical protein
MLGACPSDSDSSGEVNSVTVSPKTVELKPGETQTFTATVDVTGDAEKTVTWKVEGTGKDAGTTISTQGLLIVASTETAASLTVTAVATADTSKSDTATVTVLKVGQVSITIDFAGDITVTGVPEGDIIISKSGDTKTIELTASSDYTNPVWYVDGDATGKSSAASITLDAKDYAVANHSVSFTGTKDGVLYSKEITFTVVD